MIFALLIGLLFADAARLAEDAWKRGDYENRPDVRNPGEKVLTIAGLCGRYVRHSRTNYVKRGKPTTHVLNTRYALRSLRDCYGSLPASASSEASSSVTT